MSLIALAVLEALPELMLFIYCVASNAQLRYALAQGKIPLRVTSRTVKIICVEWPSSPALMVSKYSLKLH